MAITWACRLSVADYVCFGPKAPVPRATCGRCQEPMAFDGSYARRVREAGVVHRIFVRRAPSTPIWGPSPLLRLLWEPVTSAA